MSVHGRKLLDEIRAVGGEVARVGINQLKLVASEPLPESLVKQARAAKAELLETLAETPQAAFDAGPLATADKLITDNDEGAEFEERSAIPEFDGGLPREWAEALARLNAERPPANISPREWRDYVHTCFRLGDDWSARAASLGWRPRDIFGYDGRGLFPYMGRSSLAWLVSVGGYTVVHLDAWEAIVGTGAGRQRILRRVAHQLLVWRPEEYLH